MRIVMLLGRSTGGIGTHVGHLTQELRRLGHDVTIFTDPLTADRFGWSDALRSWPASGSDLRKLSRMRALLARADVVHAHGLQAGSLAALLLVALRPRPRFVVSLHNAILTDGPRGRVGREVERLVVRSADLVTGASGDLVTRAAELGARTAELAAVPSPQVEGLLAQAAPTPQERAALASALLGAEVSSRPLVLTVSRIAPQKSLGVLVSAAGQLRTPVVWAVVGDGDRVLLGELEEAAADTGVRFLGASTEVGSWLRAATVFVLPSAWEARSLVVQDAMAAGTPVIATDVGGLHDLVGDAGVLVPTASPAALAAAVDDLLADPQRRAELGRRGRTRARTWDDGEATARQWVSWYAAAES